VRGGAVGTAGGVKAGTAGGGATAGGATAGPPVAGIGATMGALVGANTSLARPTSGWGEVSRILVFTANAAAPMPRTNSSETITATFDLMTSR